MKTETKTLLLTLLELKDRFVIYHGSYCEVKKPDLAKCAKRKDFGQGFYLTTLPGLLEKQVIRKQTIFVLDSCCQIN